MSREPPLYRPLAVLALGAALLAGVPLGVWMLVRLHGGLAEGGPVPPAWILLHAHLQTFGFFATLILAVAQHLVPRFAGRPVTGSPLTARLFPLMLGGLLARVVGAAAGSPAWALAGAVLELAALLAFGVWLSRALAPRALRVTRGHLGLATAWLVVALAVEAALLGRALVAGLPAPDPGPMRAVHAMALLGGVAGWIVGVTLRAAPMFVPRWRVAEPLARLAPWTLALGVVVTVTAEAVGGGSRAVALARLGEATALGTVAVVVTAGGALRRPGRALLLAGARGPELWTFRLAMVSLGAAALGSLAAAGLAGAGVPLSLLADTLRHLATVGFLTAMVVAMAFRLIPVLEGVPLPWPGLRGPALGALLAAVVLRSAEALADYGLDGVLPWLPLSGVFVWLALACVAANLLGAIARAGAARARSLAP